MIKPVSYSEIFDAPNAKELLDAYCEECGVLKGTPQIQMYADMEKQGKVKGFGAFLSGKLIGFVSVLTGVNPHHGNPVAAIDSLFVLKAYRNSAAGANLMAAAERYALEFGSKELVYTARHESELDTVLSRRSGCRRTHVMYTKTLAVR